MSDTRIPRKMLKGIRGAFSTNGTVWGVYGRRSVLLGDFLGRGQLRNLILEGIGTRADSLIMSGKVNGSEFSQAAGSCQGFLSRFFGGDPQKTVVL